MPELDIKDNTMHYTSVVYEHDSDIKQLIHYLSRIISNIIVIINLNV